MRWLRHHVQADAAGALDLNDCDEDHRVDWLKAIRSWQEELLSSLPPDIFVRVFKEDFLVPSINVYDRNICPTHLPKVIKAVPPSSPSHPA